MSNRLHKLISLLLFNTTVSFLAVVIPAQAMPPTNDQETYDVQTNHSVSINDLFYDAFFQNTGDIYFQNSFTSQVIQFFGLDYFDNQITADAEKLNYYQRKIMRQQNDFGPVMRGRDLPSPFDTTLQENPCYLLTPSEGYCSK